jgi:PPOX class probable F420-dependent enzyme
MLWSVPYHPMTDDEVRAFLDSDPPHTAKLATMRADGSPHVAPVWFALDDDGSIVFTTGAHTVKGTSLLRDPRVSLCVDDERPPFSFVRVDGTVEISEDPAELLHWATVLGGRYMGAEQAEGYGRRNAVPGELLVRVRPARTASAADLAL